nr:hypothetical protein [uncultured Arsenicibacter sp.]
MIFIVIVALSVTVGYNYEVWSEDMRTLMIIILVIIIVAYGWSFLDE